MASTLQQSRERIAEVARRFAAIGLSSLVSGATPAARRDALRLSSGKAALIDGVHIFVKVLDFDNVVGQPAGMDTAFAEQIQTLTLVYRAFDNVCEALGIQRVDYDGPCLQALVPGLDDPKSQVTRAVEFCIRITRVLDGLWTQGAAGSLTPRLRYGLALGPAVALFSGRASEPAPLVLGGPVDEALKLASGGDAGMFLSPQAANAIGVPGLAKTMAQTHVRLSDDDIERMGIDNRKIEVGFDTAAAEFGSEPFAFHYYPPPLEKLDFPRLSPKNSVSMEIVSVLAGVNGYTDYLDSAISSGNIQDAVRFLYVLRWEFNDVLRCDFRGQKVRFVRESTHGILAEGDAVRTDRSASVNTAQRCAEAMQSSFNQCLELLKPKADCALTVGFAYGPACISSIGEHAVRCVIGPCVASSMRAQQACKPGQILLGE